VTFTASNHQGSLAATLSNTSTTSYLRYKPYGDQRGPGTAPNQRAFLNQVKDTPQSLTYLNQRSVDTHTGTFTTVDPLTVSSRDPYIYANANPIGLSDPSGLCAADNGTGSREACIESKKKKDEAVPPGSGGPGTSGLKPPPPVLEIGTAGTNGSVQPPKANGVPIEGADEDDGDVVKELYEVGKSVAQDNKTEWDPKTSGVCVAGEVGVLGFGGGAQVCSFETPVDGPGSSLSIYGRVGLIGPSLGVSATAMLSNATRIDQFDGDFICLTGSYGAGVGAVCGGLSEDGELTGVYQVFTGVGATLGVSTSFALAKGYTWAWENDERERNTVDDDPTGENYVGRHNSASPTGFYDAGTPASP
jgi:RHS repeat-associated protein